MVNSSKIKDSRVSALELLKFTKIAWKWQGNESEGWLLLDPIWDERESISRKGSGARCISTDL